MTEPPEREAAIHRAVLRALTKYQRRIPCSCHACRKDTGATDGVGTNGRCHHVALRTVLAALAATGERPAEAPSEASDLFAAFQSWVAADEGTRGLTHLALWSDGCGRVEGAVYPTDLTFDNIADGVQLLRSGAAAPVREGE